MDSWDWLRMDAWERKNPPCPDCDGEGYRWRVGHQHEPGTLCERCCTEGLIDRELGRHADAPDRPQWRPQTERS